jgi:type IV pilus assembly protein PilB
LHTNDAPSAVARLADIGIESFYVSSSLLMVVAQRLLRRLCPKCKEPTDQIPPFLIKKRPGLKTIYRAKGCEHCAKTGYAGRFAVYEIMVINEEIQRLTLQKAGTGELREAARRAGMATLEESAYYRIASGDTSLEEVMRVTLGEA